MSIGGVPHVAPGLRLGAALACAILLMGVLDLGYPSSSGSFSPEPVEVPFGKLDPATTVGVNATNASADVVGTLLSSTTNVLYVNNTNASGPWFLRLDLRAASGVSNLVTVTVGIDNGTKTSQITGTLGSITQSTGPHVRLEPGSTNTIYVTQTVSLLGLVSTLGLDVYASDTADGGSYVKTRATVRVT